MATQRQWSLLGWQDLYKRLLLCNPTYQKSLDNHIAPFTPNCQTVCLTWQAEKTFKFLEVCHRKLMTAYTRQTESVHQRTRREEEELKQDRARRRQIDRE